MRIAQLVAALFASWFVNCCYATTTVSISASDAGSLYVCDGCAHDVNRADPELAGGNYIQGVVRFPTALIGGPVTHAELSFMPFADAITQTVDIYGSASGGATITYSDAFIGSRLGALATPFGNSSPLTFNVTSFLASAHVPYVEFSVRSSGTAQFYQPQLNVTFIPEPTTATLLLLGMLGCVGRQMRTDLSRSSLAC